MISKLKQPLYLCSHIDLQRSILLVVRHVYPYALTRCYELTNREYVSRIRVHVQMNYFCEIYFDLAKWIFCQ